MHIHLHIRTYDPYVLYPLISMKFTKKNMSKHQQSNFTNERDGDLTTSDWSMRSLSIDFYEIYQEKHVQTPAVKFY